MSSLEKCLFRSFTHFLIDLFVFLVLRCLYILEINPSSVVSFSVIYCHAAAAAAAAAKSLQSCPTLCDPIDGSPPGSPVPAEGCLFTLFIVSFTVQKHLNLIRSYLFIFSSAQFSRSVVSDSLRPHELQHARPCCPSPTPRVHSDSCPSSQ